MAIASSPTVRASNASEAATKALTRSARSTYVPGLRVTGGYNWSNQTQLVGAVRPGWSVALGSSYPLFNGFQREDAVTRADVSAEVARVAALDVTRQTRAEAARLIAGLRFAERNIALAQDAGERRGGHEAHERERPRHEQRRQHVQRTAGFAREEDDRRQRGRPRDERRRQRNDEGLLPHRFRRAAGGR